MRNISYISSITKCFLLMIFLYNIGLLGSLYDLFADVQNEKFRESHELSLFMAEKVRAAEWKIDAKQFYSEEEYHADLADIFRKMQSLHLEPGEPNVVHYLGRLCYGRFNNYVAINGGRADIAKVIDKNEDIYQYFQTSKSLVEKEDITHLPQWLWNMYVKNFLVALAYLLLECCINKNGLRNPFSFVVLLVLYPVTIGFIFYKWCRLLGRSYIAETELRRSKEKLFSLLSDDEIAQIKKFAESKKSLKSWRKGLLPKHSFILALVVTIFISVVPRGIHAEVMHMESQEISVFKSMQHLPRMDIEHSYNCIDLQSHPWVCEAIPESIFDLSVVCLAINGTLFYVLLLSAQEVLRKIEHVPLSRTFIIIDGNKKPFR